ncbi:hypothetical protein V7S43_016841 [Phytophthora oleae]|uniref:Uncharacterized protein n=1 Tax=Phytophthora oleae TaxID=2107226 RepID=A0ABD3EY04_9STRA
MERELRRVAHKEDEESRVYVFAGEGQRGVDSLVSRRPDSHGSSQRRSPSNAVDGGTDVVPGATFWSSKLSAWAIDLTMEDDNEESGYGLTSETTSSSGTTDDSTVTMVMTTRARKQKPMKRQRPLL